MNIDAAVGYVVAHGDPVERTRLSYLRTGAVPAAQVLDRIAAEQTPGGGWPASGDAAVPSVDATCFRLAELDDLGGLHGPAVDRALNWLASAQQPAGTWEEDASLAVKAPPWAMPGNPEARFYLTAVAGFWFAVADIESRPRRPDPSLPGRHDEVLAAAADHIVGELRPDGTWPSFLAAGWHVAGLLQHRQSFYESARVQFVLGDRLEGMSPADVASMAAALRRVNLGNDWLLEAARKRLGKTQRTDGGWDSDVGPVFDVHTTLAAIRAFR